MKRLQLWLTMAMMSLTTMAQTPTVVMPAQRGAQKALVLKAPAKAAGEVRDDNGIIITPAAGEEVVFNRSGKTIFPVGYQVSEGEQTGTAKFVFCEDGTVYLNHPLLQTLERCGFSQTDTWIKGRQEGDRIIFPGGQPISYSNGYRSRIVLAMGDYVLGVTGAPECTANVEEDIVFQITRAGKIISLLNSSSTHFLCITREGKTDGYDYWDFETTFVRDTTSEHDEAVTLPAGVSTKSYIAAGYDASVDASGYTIGNVSFATKLGFDGNDAYLGNFSFYGLDHWLKGTRQADGSIVFPKEQYFSTLSQGNYDLYAYALPHGSMDAAEACDLVLTYDAATGDYVSGMDLFISYEKMTSTLERAERIENFRVLAIPEVAVAPIYNAPNGYHQLSYDRHGLALGSTMGWYTTGQEGFKMDIAYNPVGNDVYMLSPIGAVELDSWVKGTIEEDGKLHVPTMQWIQHDDEYGDLRTAVFQLKWINESNMQYTYEFLPDVKEVTFTIDEDGFLTLDPLTADAKEGEMPPTYTYGLLRGTDEYSWSGYCDAYSIYTPIEGSDVIVDNKEDEKDDDTDKIDISQLCPGEQHNEFDIITAPGNGTEMTFSRSGDNYAYVSSTGELEEDKQSGVIHIVETADGYVFMQQPISTYSKAYAATSWIKGVKRNGEYVFPKGQAISYDAYYGTSLVVYMGTYDSSDGTFMPDWSRDIVYTLSDDGKTLTLQNTSNIKPLALFYDDDDAWVGYGDYNTVLTYMSGGLVEEKVEPSWKAERLNYTLTANDLEEGPKGYNAVLAFDGNDVYLGNFCFWADYYNLETGKYVWIKGKRQDDGSLFFPREQFLYRFEEAGKGYDLFVYGVTETFENAYSPTDLTFTYNAAADMYVANEEILLTWGRITTSIPRAEQLSDAILVRDEFDGSRPYIISEQPKGQLLSYRRSGFAFNNYMNNIFEDTQDGMDIDIVFSEDGKYVYMQNPISKTLLDSWVSGTVDADGNLHFPLFQWLDYNDDYGYGVRTAGCLLVENGATATYYMVPNLVEMSFTFDALTGSYSLDRLEAIDYDSPTPRMIYGCFWSNDNSWTGFGDFDSVYTPNFDYDGIPTLQAPTEGVTYYDFSGRRLQRPNGLAIKNGKKMIVK